MLLLFLAYCSESLSGGSHSKYANSVVTFATENLLLDRSTLSESSNKALLMGI